MTRSFGPSLDDLYEQELKTCRKLGHDLTAMVSSGGAESLECRRCGTVFEESEVPTESAAPLGPVGGAGGTKGGREPAAGSIRATVVPFNRIHRMQTRRVGLDEAMESHPSAGGVLSSDDGYCPVHRVEHVLDCVICADRRTT